MAGLIEIASFLVANHHDHCHNPNGVLLLSLSPDTIIANYTNTKFLVLHIVGIVLCTCSYYVSY